MKPSPVSAIAGEPARAALQTLIRQFSDRSAFIRELVQNSLDAGAARIEVDIQQKDKVLRIQVTDDGEGMTRTIIQNALLTLFSSTKERDQTRIGKFGVGFVSIFAVEPTSVRVETGREGTHHTIEFDREQRYKLYEHDTPFEGTTVTLAVAIHGNAAQKLTEELKTALYYWCKYARAEILLTGTGSGWDLHETVTAAFELDLPCVLQVQEPDFRAVLGFSDTPFSGFYNRGLTLLESKEFVLPGVAFRVEAAGLEHTLTRDNVRRDGAYEQILARLENIVKTRLMPLHHQRLCQDSDYKTWKTLIEATRSPLCGLPDTLACIPTLAQKRVSSKELGGGWFGRSDLYSGVEGRLADAVMASGKIVLLPKVTVVLAEILKRKVVTIEEAWVLTEPAELPPALAGMQGGKLYGAKIAGKLGVWVRERGQLEVDEPLVGGVQVINADHPLVQKIEKLPIEIGRALVIHQLTREQGKVGSPGAVVAAVVAKNGEGR